MLHDILVFLPLATLIVMALLTRRMAESVITACLLAMVLLYGGNLYTGFGSCEPEMPLSSSPVLKSGSRRELSKCISASTPEIP